MPNQYKPGTDRLYIRIPKDLKDLLSRIAEFSGISVNKFVENAIRREIERIEKK